MLGRLRPVATGSFGALALSLSSSASADEVRPVRIGELLGLPESVRVGLETRTRYEHVVDDFRATPTRDVRALSQRTLLAVELGFGSLFVGGELEDARVWATRDAPLTAQFVDTLEPLQAYVGVRGHGVTARAGRMTVDVGSRRLLARNDFRNTLNGFTGVDVEWRSKDDASLRAFGLVPVTRLPSDLDAVSHNRGELDEEDFQARILGAYARSPRWTKDAQLDGMLLVLREDDTATAPSANRRLVVSSLRVFVPPRRGGLDFQVETMAQVGTSRATTADKDRKDLNHLATSFHADVGYRFATKAAPRVSLFFDHASGDASPKDGKNGRFDPLFGTANLDFGPTGFYGAVNRSNVVAPGARGELTPLPKVEAMAAHRLVWLASARDAWTTAGLRDPSGASGSFVGQQLELRIRVRLVPQTLTVELGGAMLVRGRFAREAPKGSSEATKYGQLTVLGTL